MVLGFLLSYQYNYTKKKASHENIKNQLSNEEMLREKLVLEKEANRELVKRVQEVQREVAKFEESIAQQQSSAKKLLEQLESIRMLGGYTAVEGPGVTVTLNDSQQIPKDSGSDISKYIVHEADILWVVNELMAAGAEAIDINGQRLVSNSSIKCVGPTVIVNGVRSGAPFKITAIGDTKTMLSGLEMPGGVLELMRDWRLLDINIQQHEEVEVPAFIGGKLTSSK